MIESSKGFISCQLLRNIDKSNHIVIIEKWQSIEDHKKSAKNIPEDKCRLLNHTDIYCNKIVSMHMSK